MKTLVLARTALVAACLCELSACAIAPNTVRTEVQHISHISQHFGTNTTNVGAQLVGVTAEWRRGGLFVDWTESYNLSTSRATYAAWSNPDGSSGWTRSDPCSGGICGPREVTTFSIGYEWRIKP